MYSKEFMKFLYGYQKDDFKPTKESTKKITFTKPKSGKLAEVIVTNNSPNT